MPKNEGGRPPEKTGNTMLPVFEEVTPTLSEIGISKMQSSRFQAVANIPEGALQDAKWLSLSANKTHGKQRCNEDKRRAIELAFKHPNSKELTALEIADHIGVSKTTVEKYNPNRVKCHDDTLHGSAYFRRGRDGKTRIYRNGTTRPSITAKIIPEIRQSPSGLLDILDDRKERTKLAKLEPEQQLAVIERIENQEASSVKAAMAEDSRKQSRRYPHPTHEDRYLGHRLPQKTPGPGPG